MGRQEPGEYVGRREAAAMLGIEADTLTRWVKKGLLMPRMRGRIQNFRRSDVLLLMGARDSGDTDLHHVKGVALQALAAARATEVKLAQVLDHLGLSVEPIDRDPDAIRQLYAATRDEFGVTQLRDTSWIRYWGGVLFSIDEVYFELVEMTLGDEEPWRRLMEFTNAVIRASAKIPEVVEAINTSDNIRAAYKYFHSARNHLWHIGYMRCRHSRGRRVANAVFGGAASAVEELMALLH